MYEAYYNRLDKHPYPSQVMKRILQTNRRPPKQVM